MAAISAKIFIGTKMTAELRPLVDQLTLVHHEEREYLGHYATTSAPTLEEVRLLCHELASLFQEHRSEVSSRAPKIVVFSQLFLG